MSKIYCGTSKTPKKYKKGTAQECFDKGPTNYKYWGVEKFPQDIIDKIEEVFKEDKELNKEKIKLRITVTSSRRKIKRLINAIKSEKNLKKKEKLKTEAKKFAAQLNESLKRLTEIEQKKEKIERTIEEEEEEKQIELPSKPTPKKPEAPGFKSQKKIEPIAVALDSSEKKIVDDSKIKIDKEKIKIRKDKKNVKQLKNKNQREKIDKFKKSLFVELNKKISKKMEDKMGVKKEMLEKVSEYFVKELENEIRYDPRISHYKFVESFDIPEIYDDPFKPHKDILTSFVNEQLLARNEHQIKLIKLIYKHFGPFTEKYDIKLIFYGGNLMRLINNNIKLYLDPHTDEIIDKIFSNFVKKSDNDFVLMGKTPDHLDI